MDDHQKKLQKERRNYLLKLMTSARGREIDLDTYNAHHVFVVFGFSGSGKDAVINGFLEKNTRYPFSKFIRTLTRHKRPDENELLSGYFLERELFDHLKDRERFFYCYEKYDGDEFGYDSIHLIFLLSSGNVIIVGGGEQNLNGLVGGIKSVFNNVPITTIFINRPKEDIKAGILKRGGEQEQIEKRLHFVEEHWRDRPEAHFDHFIWAEDLSEGIDEFRKIVEATLEPQKA